MFQKTIVTINRIQYIAGGMEIFLKVEDYEKLISFIKARMGLRDLIPRMLRRIHKIDIH